MNSISKLLIVLLASSIPLFVYGQAHTPASFGSYSDQFVSKLDFPDIGENNLLTVKCAGHVTDRGKFDSLICLDDPDFGGDRDIPREMGSEIRRVAQDVRVNPARVEGRRVEVWYSFTVLFQKRGGNETIEVVDNHFRNKDNYGENYIAAQRYNGGNSSCTSSLRSAVFMQVAVNEGGEVQSVSPMGNASGGSCTGKLIEDMQESTYIPAFFEGHPVASTYVEIFTN